ncbi:hypothetical protein [Actinopolymorpha pittospori]|uniref:Uncharacterized protein n=1 Tax=Actinopolymorpha pittospori TaxID=648752 RepID=A0A927MQ10_9ACTN|nr:hypothetical protein [Actinopolymorpha pittospori]
MCAIYGDTFDGEVITLADNAAAISLYRKHGYQLVDSTQRASRGQPRDFPVRHGASWSGRASPRLDRVNIGLR